MNESFTGSQSGPASSMTTFAPASVRTLAAMPPPARPSASKTQNYECGAEPIGNAWVQFPVGFYLVALIFIVFDTLAVFLFPWALTIRALGANGLEAMLAFVAILGLAWVYAYRE